MISEGEQDGMDWRDRTRFSPDVMGGKPVIRGKRVPVQGVVGALAGGSSLQQVCAGYGITEDDVRAALAYAAEVLGPGKGLCASWWMRTCR